MLNLVIYREQLLAYVVAEQILLPTKEHMATIDAIVDIVIYDDACVGQVVAEAKKREIENISQMSFINSRLVLSSLSQQQASRIIYYRSLLRYYENKFCSICGSNIHIQLHN